MTHKGLVAGVALVLAASAIFTFREARHRGETRTLGREISELRAGLEEVRSLRKEDRALVSGTLGKLARERRNELSGPSPVTHASSTDAETDAARDAPEGMPDGENPMERLRFQQDQAVERMGEELDERLSREAIDPAWARSTGAAIATVFQNLPGNRVLSTDCRAQLCRVAIEHTSGVEQFNFAGTITQGAPFDQDTLFRYDRESKPPKTTVYVMRDGIEMKTLVRARAL